MANLKVDLVNKLTNEKYFNEIELIRLAGDPNTNYKGKLESMSNLLKEIALANAQLGLVEQYFKEEAPQNAPAPAEAQPQGQVHQGQSHGE